MYTSNPFGNPDGSREKIENMMESFISFDSRYYPIKETNIRTRVIVGAKGSGKTVYLRRMKAIMRGNSSVYTTEIATELPSTEHVIRFCQLHDINILTEKWMTLWRCALLRSLTSHILCSSELNSFLLETEKRDIKRYTNKLFPVMKVPMDPYTEARNILSFYTTRSEFESFFSLREWDELDAILSHILPKLPPIYFFLDCIDDEYSHAPMYWMRCQKGLFYRCMRFLRHSVYGSRFHIVICIRDQVLSSVYQSEHSTRYIHDGHILSLNWDYRSIDYFFQYKISELKDCYFINRGEEDAKKTIERWLGLSSIRNVIRNCDEDIGRYILRHTRLSPRDVIVIGNLLAGIKRESAGIPDYDIEKEIRRKIAVAARSFGDELLAICANQIINNQMPDSAGKMDFTEVYTSIQEYKEQTSTSMRIILDMLPSDRITWDDIDTINNVVNEKELLPEGHHMFDILWQNGGVGYIEDGTNGKPKEVFFVDCNYELFTLPKYKSQYIFRSCLIDCLGLQKKVSDKPVIGGNV